MKKYLRELQSFFYGQNFADGIRVTIGVLLPALLFSYYGQLLNGITLALGALGTSLADSPGPAVHRRNGMLVCTGLCTMVALVTGFAHLHVLTMGLVLLVFCFVFSMLQVYGMRASLIGLGALLVMIMTMDRPLEPLQILIYSGLVMAGGVWYLLLSLLSFHIMPYRVAQQALGECILETAKFLRLKASFYQPKEEYGKEYRKLVTQQITVSEKQDAVRELLFKSRQIVNESTDTGRTLVLTFIDLVDLYEQIMAVHYDYSAISRKFGATGILNQVSGLIEDFADHLANIGYAMQANQKPPQQQEVQPKLQKLKESIDNLQAQQPEASTLVLKKILVNARNIAQRLASIESYFHSKADLASIQSRKLEVAKFISHQNYSPSLFLSNLTYSSSVFRFALRVALVTCFAYALTKVFPYGQHSYWVLLTVVIILKPAFSLTKQRNKERIAGTLAGGVIGLLVLYLVQNETLQFVFLLLFMVGFYSVQRNNYLLGVTLLTPFMLILFSFLGGGGLAIIKERVIDTLVGCAIALTATYYVFPNWEFRQVGQYLQNVLQANLNYLQVLANGLAGQAVPEIQYKLARKEVYVSSANLSAAFQRMTAEPKRKQKSPNELYELVVLNHVLSSFIATTVSERIGSVNQAIPREFQRTIRRAQASLIEAIKCLNPGFQPPEEKSLSAEQTVPPAPLSEEDKLLAEQWEFILNLCADIQKLTKTVSAAATK